MRVLRHAQGMQDARTYGPSHAATAHAHTRGHTRAHLQARCCALGSCWPVRKLPLTSSERVIAVIPQRGPRGGRKLRSRVDRRTVKAPETARGVGIPREQRILKLRQKPTLENSTFYSQLGLQSWGGKSQPLSLPCKCLKLPQEDKIVPRE